MIKVFRHSVLALLIGVGGGAVAQEMPAWAAPSDGSGWGRTNEDITGVIEPPDLPSNPAPVPVDGGLALLAIAGAGYAVRRLRRESA